MPTDFEQALRQARIRYAQLTIASRQYVTCGCGQHFYAPEPFADHVETCEIAARRVAHALDQH